MTAEDASLSTDIPQPILPQHPAWLHLYERSWELARRNIEQPPLEGWHPQMCCMPGSGRIWQWDSCLMALFCKYAQAGFPGLSNLDNLYACQAPDGYISMAYDVVTGEPAYGTLVNPPLYAWVEWDWYEMSGNAERLARVFPKLVRYYGWLQQHRRWDNGLYWFAIPGASGMDNSPRGGRNRDGSNLCWIDLSSQQALAAECLAKIAEVLDEPTLVERFRGEYDDLKRRINDWMWHDRTGFYYDIFTEHPGIVPNVLNHKTVAGFWPLLAGLASARQAQRLVEHLLNPSEFWTSHPIPSLSKDDPNYDPLGGYWRGGVWSPTNYMVVRGLLRYGYGDVAREVVKRHLAHLYRVEQEFAPGTLWECYSPDYARPATAKCGELSRPHFVGWSGLGPTAMLIESLLGIRVLAPQQTIEWDVGLIDEHGIRGLPCGSRTVDLHCAARQSPTEQPRVVLASTVDVTVNVHYGPRTLTRHVRAHSDNRQESP